MELLFHRRTPSVSSWRFTPEPRRAAEEGLSDEELALFDLLLKDNISKSDQEKLTQASRGVLASLQMLLATMQAWTHNTSTQAEVKVFILDCLWQSLLRPPFIDKDTEAVSDRIYELVWQRSASTRPAAFL